MFMKLTVKIGIVAMCILFIPGCITLQVKSVKASPSTLKNLPPVLVVALDLNDKTPRTLVNNPYSSYGSPFSNQSATNPFATDAPRLSVLAGLDQQSLRGEESVSSRQFDQSLRPRLADRGEVSKRCASESCEMPTIPICRSNSYDR